MLILSIICFRILSNTLLVCFYTFMFLGETELKTTTETTNLKFPPWAKSKTELEVCVPR